MIVVNPSTRQFSIPGADLVFGVTADAGSTVKEFSCPRYVGNNLDLAGSFVRMNYRNANGEVDSYLVSDVAVDGDNVVFGWELTPKVTMYKGNVSFVMCVVGPDTKVKWHTTLGRGQVLEGLEPDSSLVELETADVVTQLITMVEAQTEAVAAEGSKQIKAVQTAAQTAQSDAVAQIEAKGVNTRNSIPADYTALSEAVDTLVRGRAGTIVCSAEGSAITVNDASDNYMQGLRIFGRSTQDGTPSPEAPVEIVSVEKPKVSISNKNLCTVGHIDLKTTSEGFCLFEGFVRLPVTLSWTQDFARSGGSALLTYTIDGIERYMASGESVGTEHWTFKNGYALTKISVVNWQGEKGNLTDIQLEFGDNHTDFQPPNYQTVELTHTLPGIPVTSGGNYTDSEGQQWVCDEVDLERGVYVQRVMLADYDGSDDERWVKSAESYFYLVKTSMTYPSKANGVALATRFVFVSGSLTQPGYFKLGNAYGPMVRVPEGVTDVEGLRTWIAANPFSVVYELDTPIETALSETEIAAYRAMHSNYPNTTVLNDAGAHMVVKYAADTRLYIDNKIAALVGGV